MYATLQHVSGWVVMVLWYWVFLEWQNISKYTFKFIHSSSFILTTYSNPFCYIFVVTLIYYCLPSIIQVKCKIMHHFTVEILVCSLCTVYLSITLPYAFMSKLNFAHAYLHSNCPIFCLFSML